MNAVAPDWNLKQAGTNRAGFNAINAVAPDWNLKSTYSTFATAFELEMQSHQIGI